MTNQTICFYLLTQCIRQVVYIRSMFKVFCQKGHDNVYVKIRIMFYQYHYYLSLFWVFFYFRLFAFFFFCGQIQLEELLTIPPQVTDD